MTQRQSDEIRKLRSHLSKLPSKNQANRQRTWLRADSSFGGHFEDDDSLWSYVFAECEICRQTLVIRRRIDESSGHRKGVFEILWPALERNLSDAVPVPLRQEHSEARACFNAKAYTATVVMVRRTLEGVCADHGVTRKPLYAALDEMRSAGLIEGRLLEPAKSCAFWAMMQPILRVDQLVARTPRML